MSRRGKLDVADPASGRRKSFTFDRKKFLPALVKAILAALPIGVGMATGTPIGGVWDIAQDKITGHLVDLVASLGLKTTPEQLASRLIFTAASKAAFELAREAPRRSTDEGEHDALFTGPEAILARSETEGLADKLKDILTDAPLVIDKDFFKRPAKALPIETIAGFLSEWLGKLGIAQAQNIANRYERYFVCAVYDEWKEKSLSYAQLLAALETPFDAALKNAMAWERYWAHLRRQVQLPMMAESFGLDAVYIRLRAYFITKACPDDECTDTRGLLRQDMADKKIIATQHVVDLHKAVRDWLANDDKEDAIRLVCGGPGSGKSSFAKILAADLAAEDQHVVFVPLARQPLDKPLKDIVGGFLQESGFLPFHPMDDLDKPLLLILDGLDELSMLGSSGFKAATLLMNDVVLTTTTANSNTLRLRCLITGRDLSVQKVEDIIRRAEATLHLLPYYIEKKKETPNSEDPEDLLGADQRDDWWRGYGLASGQGFKGMPEILRQQDRLQEMSGQPLLNYLLAVLYVQDPKELADASLPTIYERLLSGVYYRDYAKPHPALGHLELKEFLFALENIAVTIWHGDGRTANLTELRAHCDSPSLKKLLDRVLGGLDQGLMRLLTAFYFRQAVQRGESETFEFTHKSFGEYLTARNIVATLDRLHKEYLRGQRDFRSPWTPVSALQEWLALCAPSPMDDYLYEFVEEIIAGKPVKRVNGWREFCASLLGFVQAEGMPMGPRPENLSFKSQCQQARNAEVALLAVHCACAQRAETVSTIDWPSPTGPREWLSWLEPAANHTLARRSLAYLNLEGAKLTGADLRIANLRGAKLGGAKLMRAGLTGANLEEADLEEADLWEANLEEADLREANLRGAILNGANLRMAKLWGANFMKADLAWADLGGADLGGVDLREANLKWADLGWADLGGANLGGTSIGFTKNFGRSLADARFDDPGLKKAFRAGVDFSQLKTYCIGNPTPEQAQDLAELMKGAKAK